VSTFGKFHFWNRDDPIKERILVYASFSSPALVPRDVVFGKFSTVGGVKETWTAPVFILSAEFAEQLPADEDPMPPDGNPHPMPGNLQPNMNLFVPPQYPEIGWDAVEEIPDAPVQEPMQDNMNEMADLGIENQQSMVLNMSVSSSDSVNMVDDAHGPGGFDVIQVGRVEIGPILPPPLMWARLMHSFLPELLSKSIPIAMRSSPFSCLKRNWDTAFEFQSGYVYDHANDKRIVLTVKPKVVEENFCFTTLSIAPVITALHTTVDDRQKNICCDMAMENSSHVSPAFVQASVSPGGSPCSTPTVKIPVRRKKQVVQLNPSLQRVTRSVSANKGFRAAPIKELQPQPKKRARKVEPSSAVRVLMRRTPESSGAAEKEAGCSTSASAVMVSIPVMQHIGDLLQMDPEDLTVAKLTAEPSDEVAKQPELDD
jgi:hypothetical protein